ncbi:hypothetical protein ACFL1G_07600 [Planctomycetota bacterium]
MKKSATINCLAVFTLVFGVTGCQQNTHRPSIETDDQPISVYARYAPIKIRIIPLTKFDLPENKIHLYVSLLDSFNSQIKAPAVFRFEIYEKVQRSAEPKGKRIYHWQPDIDLTGLIENNNHWSDFLRAYEFKLDFEPKENKSYILQVTSMLPNGKRLSAEIDLKSP